MNIIDVISNATGFVYRRKASTLGGEFSGPCCFCSDQGEDRFSIHPAQNHFVCRRCHKAGDSIEFVKLYYNKSYIEACKFLDIQPTMKFSSLDTANEKPGQNEIKWEPREIIFPSKQWQEKAEAFLFEKFKFLMSSGGKTHREYLNARGINDETIKKARMGYNLSSVNFDGESWGMTSPAGQKSLKNDIWLPEGLIIPQFYNGKLIKLRIRQSNPDALTRFIVVRGSANGYFDYTLHLTNWKKRYQKWIVTESELDGWVIEQEYSNSCYVFAIGNSSARPDIESYKMLKNYPGLVNLDNDEAGQAESLWWKEHFPNCKIWYSKKGKDPGEDFQAGINISEWIQEGLSKLSKDDCGHECHNTEKYGFVPEADCPVHDKLKASTRDEKSTNKNTRVESFKDKIVNKYSKTINDLRQKQTTRVEQESPPQESKECIHNRFCVSLKDGICLINKEKAIHQAFCPAGKWYKYIKGVVTDIILGPGMDR